jgi:hypothetical protein
MTSEDDHDWGLLTRKCAAQGLFGDAMYQEVMRTVTQPRVRGPRPPLPPIRQGPPPPDEVIEYPLSEAEFVELPTTGGGTKVWQLVRYDEPDLDLAPARVYLNGFSIVWTDAGLPAELPDGTPVPPDTEDVVILDGPTIFGGVLVCLAGRPDALAWIRHDQLLIEPRAEPTPLNT